MKPGHSQFASLAWIVTIGILLLWLVGHTLSVHERMLHGTRTFAVAMAERSLLLSRLIRSHEGASERDLNDLLSAFNSPGNRVELSRQAPPLPDEQWPHAEEIRSDLTRTLDAAAPADYRVAFPIVRRYDLARDQELPGGPYILIAVQQPDGRWLTSRASTSNMAWGWQHIVISWSTLVMLLVLALVLWGARRTTRHLPRFAAAAEQLGTLANTPPLEEKGPREVRRVARAFNRMQRRIAEHSNERTNMLAAVSHDLRTYLTRLELRAENIDDPEQRATMGRDLDEMNQMLNELLQFARAEQSPAVQRNFELRSMLESLTDEQVERGHDADLTAASKATLTGDPVALKRAFSNLLDNAIRYGDAAHLRLETAGDLVLLTIDDEGSGIPPEQRQAVLKPFQRLETSRNRATGGTGLGLAIAQAIIERHRGTLELCTAPSGGLRVRVSLPVRQ